MDNKLLNEWKIVNRCNDGDFSVVYKATNNNGDICAIKEMNLPRTQDDMEILINAGIVSSLDEAATFFAQAVKNELDLMRKFKGNVNILELYDFAQEILEQYNRIGGASTSQVFPTDTPTMMETMATICEMNPFRNP